MQPLPLSAFAEALKPLLTAPFAPAQAPLISSVANNSAKVTPGTLFAAIKGAKADGHRFLHRHQRHRPCLEPGVLLRRGLGELRPHALELL